MSWLQSFATLCLFLFSKPFLLSVKKGERDSIKKKGERDSLSLDFGPHNEIKEAQEMLSFLRFPSQSKHYLISLFNYSMKVFSFLLIWVYVYDCMKIRSRPTLICLMFYLVPLFMSCFPLLHAYLQIDMQSLVVMLTE